MDTVLRRYFWDYHTDKLDNIPDAITAQRFVDFWGNIQGRLFAGEINKKTFKFILLTIKDNIKGVKFNDNIKKEVIEYLICKV